MKNILATLLVALVAALATGTLSAKIGETEAQSRAHYGAPVKTWKNPAGYEFAKFHKAGMDITCAYDKNNGGKCGLVEYKSDVMSINKAIMLMTLNSGVDGNEWIIIEKSGGKVAARAPKGKLQALYDGIAENILIFYPEFLDRMSEEVDKQTVKELE